MTYRDIAVHVEMGAPCDVRTQVALDLANAFEAHLTGIFVIQPPFIPPYMEIQVGPDIIESYVKSAREDAQTCEKKFITAAERAGIHFEWRVVEGFVSEELALHGRYADLMIAGQRDPNADLPASDMPDGLVLSLGRPVLLTPYAGNFSKFGETVMIAWDGGRLAARAIGEAMPLLKRAKKVIVMSINAGAQPARHGDIPSADISQHLARHGVNVDAQSINTEDMEAASMLLSRGADEGVDLYVMGAYGHSRLREWAMGGFTRHMLNHMTSPILMSH